ncbi:MAG: SelB C-terminal domain-containing protein [Thermodesulfobacteriota bacterium]
MFKELSQVSRKFAILLMEHFDAKKLTLRIGDKRVLRKYGILKKSRKHGLQGFEVIWKNLLT